MLIRDVCMLVAGLAAVLVAVGCIGMPHIVGDRERFAVIVYILGAVFMSISFHKLIETLFK